LIDDDLLTFTYEMKTRRALLMKLLVLSAVLPASFSMSLGQVYNGSFENGSDPDLSRWQWTCGALSEKSAPAGGGDYCISVFSGNTQGCWPGYAWQKLQSVTNEQAYVLSGWAFAQTSRNTGLYFGKINKGVITLFEGDTTSSSTWTKLSVKSEFQLSEGDTALVVLYGGLTGGPVQGYGYFDLIDLQIVTAINSPEQESQIRIFPNPVTGRINIQSERDLTNANIAITDMNGRTVRQMAGISGRIITLERGQLSNGLYVIRLEMDDKIIGMKKLIITEAHSSDR
jgi:hypothetical protein